MTLLWWIVVGVCALAVVVFLALAIRLLGPMRRFRTQAASVQLVAEDAQRLSLRVQEINERVATLNQGLEHLTRASETHSG